MKKIELMKLNNMNLIYFAENQFNIIKVPPLQESDKKILIDKKLKLFGKTLVEKHVVSYFLLVIFN